MPEARAALSDPHGDPRSHFALDPTYRTHTDLDAIRKSLLGFELIDH
jgi:hypothetical protein